MDTDRPHARHVTVLIHISLAFEVRSGRCATGGLCGVDPSIWRSFLSMAGVEVTSNDQVQ